ncbi:MAG: hypothetical protein ACLP50_03320 [Solirubrobacteraceae bacterium]
MLAAQGSCRVQRVVQYGRESWTVIGVDRRPARQVGVGDQQIELAPKEFELLQTLIADPTRVLTKVNFEPRPERKGSEGFGVSGQNW